MLSCHECERYLPVFLDHALEVKESLDVQAHLQSCHSCADRAESERYLRTFVRQYLDVPPPPDEFKRAMILRAMQAERQPGWWAYLPAPARLCDFAMGMATAALLALVMYGSYTTQHMPLEVVSADDSTVTQWLNAHMGYHIKMPCITDAATHLLGGRLCRFLDRKSVAVMYQRHGVPIILFAFHGDHMSLPSQNTAHSNGQAPVHVRSVSGRPVAMWQRDGVVYSMVGDVQRDDLMQVAATVNYR